jgi:endonuclease/exonuclease/phosphatase family metal-dependent hydrolase
MIKQLKTFTVNIFAGANVAIVLLMLATGYSDHISPVSFPLLSTMGMVFPAFLLANLLFVFFWLTFKWRRVWIPIVGYLLAYPALALYMPMHSTQDVPDGTIKLLSYNVCSYSGVDNFKENEGFDTIYHYLARQDADIVCLQEDVDTWRRYVFHRYEKIYPYNDTIFFFNQNEANGMGIHSRFPIIRRERIPYESKANGSVAWYLQVGNDTVLVINNHLECTNLTKEDRLRYEQILKGKMSRDTAREESKLLVQKVGRANAIRAIGAEAVHRYIEEHRQYPMIVCGDFNDNPISYSRHVISKGLTDCFAETGRGLGLSYNRKGFYFRIDHILCSDHFTPYNCQVDDKIDASDHYPIFCWLKLVHKP